MTSNVTVRPFEKDPDGQYIEKLSNHLFDYVMPSLSPTAWMVLCFIIRKTTGWQKDSDDISIGEIKKGTSIKSDNTIIKSIVELEERQYIVSSHRKDTRQKNTYSLNTTIKIEVVTTSKNEVDGNTTSKNEVVTTINNEVVEPETTSKNEDSKEQYIKDNINSSSGSKNGKEPSAKQLENWAMFNALLKVCKIDINLATDKIKGQFNQAGKIMRDNGHSVEDVLNFETWWYENDWRGQRSPPQAPTLQNVRDEWGKFKASKNKPKVILK